MSDSSLYPPHATRPIAELVIVPPRAGAHFFRPLGAPFAHQSCQRCGVLRTAVENGRYSAECGLTAGGSR